MEQQLQNFVSNGDIEVQERASDSLVIVQFIKSFIENVCKYLVSGTKHDFLNDLNDKDE